ncbi:MAG: hypothetical protein OXH83_20180 [Bryobacterales bacterium]|nr:hypothetical protein [Bryobacterales bacterium]
MSRAISVDLMPTMWHPSMGEHHIAVRIPVTTPTRYLSYHAALNLRLPGEHTGDWHGDVPFVTLKDSPRTLNFAGPGGFTDTTPSLGSKGVRNMAHILEGKYIPPGSGPVWVANHFRAIADYVLLDTRDCWSARYPRHVTVRCINQWLSTRERIEHLVEEYLKPLREQLPPEELELHEAWLPTVVFD